MFDDEINTGVTVWWERYLRPSITNKDTADLDSQVVRAAIDELLSFNGWVAVRLSFLSFARAPYVSACIHLHHRLLP